LLTLDADWDSYGAYRIDRGAAERVDALLQIMANPPLVVPTPGGGVCLEWHLGPNELSIEIPSTVTDERPVVFCHDDITGDEWEAEGFRTQPVVT
jgi:hypothetical protein